MAKGLRVLITNMVMNGRTGTEIVTRNLAVGLLRRGHTPIVYSPQLGEIAAELRQIGIPVVSNIDRIREAPDVIHGHHTLQAAIAAARFPATPSLFVCHDFIAWHDSPPRLPSFVRFVAVGDATYDRLTLEEGVAPASARLIENGVDTGRFRAGPTPPSLPRKAIIFAKSREQVEPVAQACKMRGIALEVAGTTVGRTLAAPEDILPGFDLVFASGMTAIEALACLRPVIVCDGRGLAGFVDSVRYPVWRRQNFGLRTLVQPLTPGLIAAEIERYDAQEALAVGQRIRTDAALDGWISRYESVYSECLAEFALHRQDTTATAAHIASHMESWSTVSSTLWERERALLHQMVSTLQVGLLPLAPGERAAVTDARRFVLRNFHPPEPWGAWSAAPTCGLIFRHGREPRELSVRIEYVPYLSPQRPRFEVKCLVNGEIAASWVDETGPAGPRTRLVALGANHGDPEPVFLSFRTSEPIAPASVGQGTDNRALGIGLIAVTLVRDGAAA